MLKYIGGETLSLKTDTLQNKWNVIWFYFISNFNRPDLPTQKQQHEEHYQ